MNILLSIQKLLLWLAFFVLFVILSKVGETASCVSFNAGYWYLIILALLSSICTFLMVRKACGSKLLFVPFVFVLLFVLFYSLYRLEAIRIYEQSVGAYKGVNYYDKPDCDYPLIKLLSTSENVVKR